MSDNVIQFGKLTIATESEHADAAREELNACIDHLLEFLETNRNSVLHFVTGVATASDPAEDDASFHIFTSRITPGDFALALAMLNKSLMRHI